MNKFSSRNIENYAIGPSDPKYTHQFAMPKYYIISDFGREIYKL